MVKLTPHNRDAIVIAYKEGDLRVIDIAGAYRVSDRTVYRVLKAAGADNARSPGSGHPSRKDRQRAA